MPVLLISIQDCSESLASIISKKKKREATFTKDIKPFFVIEKSQRGYTNMPPTVREFPLALQLA